MTRELLQKAYVALDGQWWAQNLCRQIDNALAAPQPEPVALCDALRWSGAKESHGAMMFSPDQLRKFYEFASRTAPPAEPAPAVPANKMGQGRLILEAASGMHGDVDKQLTAIYTDWLNSLAAPAVREPLTDEQIDALWRAPMSADWEHREFARAIEAHHGIGGGGK